MTTNIIAKNNTGGAINLQDLGIEIPGSGQRTLTTIFTKIEISTSTDLSDQVISGDITINNGTNDLSIINGLAHINFETEYEDVDPILDSTSFVNHSINAHTDVSSITPLGSNILRYNTISQLYVPSAMLEESDTPPDSTSEIWIDPSDMLPYFFDPNVGSWVTIDRTILTYGRSGNSDGSYLAIGGWSSSGYYYIHRNAVMTAIYCKSVSGQIGKGFEIQKNKSLLYSFNQSAEYKYINTSLNFDLVIDDEIQVFTVSTGTPISDTVCQIEIAWRYVP